MGGTRLWPYEDDEAALVDVLRLARGMTYKNAAAGLAFGGGKAVVIASPHLKTHELLLAYGRFVHRLGGNYITAADVNTNENDMVDIRKATPFVTGLPESKGGSGEPSPFTALGVFEGIKAAVFYRLGHKTLKGLRVAVQGLGSVGSELCKLLYQEGVKLFVNDMNCEKMHRIAQIYQAEAVPENIHRLEVDIFSPCALGGVLRDETLPELQCKMIVGAANNQLWDEDKHGALLAKRGILYAPDYVVNAGGVINISFEVNRSYKREEATEKVKAIYHTLMQVFQLAESERCLPHQAAKLLAEKRLINQKRTLL